MMMFHYHKSKIFVRQITFEKEYCRTVPGTPPNSLAWPKIPAKKKEENDCQLIPTDLKT
jgi:hypothetical protein